MRVLVVGAGRMGAIRVEDLVTDPRVEKVIIANRNEGRARALADLHGAEVAPWSAMADIDADATVVAVGTDAHDEVLGATLPKGRPVLCEKPIALSLEGTQAAIDLAKKHNAGFQIGFQRRFDQPIRAIREAVEADEMGTLYSMTMTAHDMTPSGREFMAGSGGIFRDMHVHDFDLVRWITDSEVEQVYATQAVCEFPDFGDFDDGDVSAISLNTVSGVQVLISGTRHGALGHDVRMEVFGSKNSVSAGLNSRTPLHAMEGGLGMNTDAYHGFVDRFRDAFLNETRAFVSFAAGEIENPCPPDSALESLRVALACDESIRTGQVVKVQTVS